MDWIYNLYCVASFLVSDIFHSSVFEKSSISGRLKKKNPNFPSMHRCLTPKTMVALQKLVLCSIFHFHVEQPCRQLLVIVPDALTFYNYFLVKFGYGHFVKKWHAYFFFWPPMMQTNKKFFGPNLRNSKREQWFSYNSIRVNGAR